MDLELAVLGGVGRSFYVSSAGLTDADAPGILFVTTLSAGDLPFSTAEAGGSRQAEIDTDTKERLRCESPPISEPVVEREELEV